MVGIDPTAEDLLLAGVNRKQFPGVTVEQVAHHEIAELSALARRADHSDPPRIEHRLAPMRLRRKICRRDIHVGICSIGPRSGKNAVNHRSAVTHTAAVVEQRLDILGFEVRHDGGSTRG